MRALASFLALVFALPACDLAAPIHGATLLDGVDLSRDPPRVVVLLVVDTLRADELSSYGYIWGKTPGMDRLTELGLSFSEASSHAPWTRPSVASIVTGRFPRELGLLEKPEDGPWSWRQRRKERNRHLPDSVVTLAERMSMAGYTTVGFVNQPFINGVASFTRGFDQWYRPVEGPAVDAHDTGPGKAPGQQWEGLVEEALAADALLIDEFDTWITEHSDEKVFAWVHLLGPHRPYRPPKDLAPQAGAGRKEPFLRQSYNAEIRAVDRLVARLIKTLEFKIGLKDSAIVFTSDHGEEFWEHGHYEHGHSLHREVVHVPLVIVSPGRVPVQRLDEPVGLIDVAPSVLQLVGLEPDPELPGTSLLTLTGARPILIESMLYGESQHALIEGKNKLIVDAGTGTRRLYDLRLDPGESEDLSELRPELVADLQANLDRWIEKLDANAAQIMANSPVARNDSDRAAEEAANREALKALGYVE